MTTILALNSSALGDASVSRQLVQSTLDVLTRAEPDAEVIHRDIGAAPLPHFVADNAVPEPASAEQKAVRARTEALIDELKAADTLVIGAPMYNFGIPSTLKAWFDHVLRAGETFRYTEAGPEGLLKGKRAIALITRGGQYSEGPGTAFDAQEPHLRTLLGFIGITDITVIRAENLAMGPEPREASIAEARGLIDTQVQALAA
ncbi:FMN-dependent NADH-azoreductase [Vannielia litorea]|nr:FMN-dependent NADH-azoreductase [Vannielia litorea]